MKNAWLLRVVDCCLPLIRYCYKIYYSLTLYTPSPYCRRALADSPTYYYSLTPEP